MAQLCTGRLKGPPITADVVSVFSGSGVDSRVLRPAAVLDHRAAARVLAELERRDVSLGGVWSASASLWQRYDQPWNGPAGARGDAQLAGSIGVMYDAPARQQITLYRVTLTSAGLLLGWSVEAICDDALAWVGLTLASCPKAELVSAPAPDPFRRRAGQGHL